MLALLDRKVLEMLLKELTLTNVGPYRDTQTLKFSTAEEKPITLIGGQNGMGKTTLINALALVLYGSQSKRLIQFGNYKQYLRNLIHNGKDHAAVTLRFSRQEQGRQIEYTIVRSWSDLGNELFQCYMNGERDHSLTENSNWLKKVSGFIPLSIAGLAIFDGEKIEALADTDRANEILKTTIEGLLGLDLLTQLQQDLKELERQVIYSSVTDVERERIDQAQSELKRTENSVSMLTETLDTISVQIEKKQQELEAINDEFERIGGSLFIDRYNIKDELQRAEEAKEKSLKELSTLASGEAPLLQLPKLLKEIVAAGEMSAALDEAELLSTRFKERDEAIVTEAALFLEQQQLSQLDALLTNSREQSRINRDIPFHVRPDIQTKAQRLNDEIKTQITESVRHHLDVIRANTETAEIAGKKLKDLPEESEAAEAQRKVIEAELLLEQLINDQDTHAEHLRKAQSQNTRAEREVEKLLVHIVKEAEAGERAKRIQRESKLAVEKIKQFRNHKATANARRIAGHIEKAAKTLFRKNDLITSIDLDPTAFSMTVKDKNGETLNPDMLSAGERQLLATSILWGLSQATDKTLPTIIDTPLGRLDSSHRSNLVEQYFPSASRQVILLSTDEEIVGDHLRKLKAMIGEQYYLDGHGETNVTLLKEGYLH